MPIPFLGRKYESTMKAFELISTGLMEGYAHKYDTLAWLIADKYQNRARARSQKPTGNPLP